MNPNTHTQFKSQELNEAVVVPASITDPPTNDTSLEQIEKDFLSFITKKDHILYRHAREGKASARTSVDTNELMQSIVDEFRRQLYSTCVVENASVEKTIIINKVFENIRTNLEIVKTLQINTKRDAMLASITGNILKQLS